MESLMLDRMPTSYEIRSLKIPKLDSLISKTEDILIGRIN